MRSFLRVIFKQSGSFLVPIFPYFHQILNHINFVSSNFLQKSLIELSLFSFEPFNFDKCYQGYDDVRQALDRLLLFLVRFVLNLQLVFLLRTALLVQDELVYGFVVFTYLQIQFILFILVCFDCSDSLKEGFAVPLLVPDQIIK